jgi:hypothetical protein
MFEYMILTPTSITSFSALKERLLHGLTVNIFQTGKQPTLSTQPTVRFKRMLLNDFHEGNNAS